MQLIDGKKISLEIKEELKREISALSVKPFLVAILVGENPASISYVRGKGKACDEIGMRSEVVNLPVDISEEDLLSVIEKYNNSSEVSGIIVQLPLPKHISEQRVIEKISVDKDVDGFHAVNLGKMIRCEDAFLPATPAGIQQLLIRSGNPPQSKHVVVVGRSNIVGKPIANILLQKGETADATVTVVHSKTQNVSHYTKQADILIVAIGKPKFITADMVKEGTCIIDVGVNRIEDSSKKSGFRLVGDVDFENVKDKVKAITPVPGGVGPMTITMLLVNTLKAYKLLNK